MERAGGGKEPQHHADSPIGQTRACGHPESEIRVQGARGARVAATGGLCQAPAEIAGHGDVRRPTGLPHAFLHRKQRNRGVGQIRRRAPWSRPDCGQPRPKHGCDAQQPVCGHHEMGQGRNVSCTGRTRLDQSEPARQRQGITVDDRRVLAGRHMRDAAGAEPSEHLRQCAGSRW